MKQPLTAGFSLIELIVVSAIMVVVIGGSIAGYMQFSEYQGLVSMGRDIESTIQLAQYRARMRVIEGCNNTDGLTTNDFQGYQAEVAGNGSVNVYPLCGASAEIAARTGAAVASYTSPTNHGFGVSGGGQNFDFFTLQSRVAPTIPGVISISSLRNVYTITVSSAGVVSSEITTVP